MQGFSAKSKVWVYQSDRFISPLEQEEIAKKLEVFCTQWTAHNQALKAGSQIVFNRFIVLIVDETQTTASGCSIDKSVACIRSLSENYKINFFDRMQIPYFKNEELQTIHLNDIQEAFKNEDINESTLFCNTNISNLEEFESSFTVPLEKHWLYKGLGKVNR